MIVRIRILILAAICTQLFTGINHAQRAASAVKSDQIEISDSSNKLILPAENSLIVVERYIPDDVLSKYKNDPDFNYDGGPKEADDWITRLSNWINQQLIILSSSKAYSTLIDILYYGLMVMAIIIIIRGLYKADRRGLLFGKVNTDELKFSEEEEDISQLNFDELIAAAIESKQYKLAVRYMYLKSLQLLSEKGFIDLRNNKTNYQYLSEIKNDQISSLFRNTTQIFERIWYGDTQVDDNIINYSRKDFNKLYALIIS